MRTNRRLPLNARKQAFIDRAIEVHSNKYDYTRVVYVNNSTPVEIVCPVHGPFYQRPANHLTSKEGCFMCGKNRAGQNHRWTQEDYISEVSKIHGNKYDYTKTTYVGSFIPIVITCPEHGDFTKQPNDHLFHASGCPSCASDRRTSRGERVIINTLDYYDVPYLCQHKFPGLVGKYGHPLRVDFFLPAVNAVIEFDGPHHVQPVRYKGTTPEKAVTTHELTIEYDMLKEEYCKEKGIQLIRIPYTQLRKTRQILESALNLTTSNESSTNS